MWRYVSYHIQCSWIIISFYAGNQSGYIGLNVCFSSDLVKTWTENNILVHKENSHSDEKLKKNFSGNSSLKSVNSQNKRLYIARVSHLSTCYLQNPSLAMAFGSRLLSSQQLLLWTDSYKATDAGSILVYLKLKHVVKINNWNWNLLSAVLENWNMLMKKKTIPANF